MKKVLSISLLMILVLTVFVSCNGAVDERLWGTKEHIHYYEVQNDGSWKCVNKNCPETLLKGTDKPYITVVVDKQPTEIIPLTENIDISVGSGKLVVDGLDIKYTNLSGNAQEIVIRTNGGRLTINGPNDHMEHFGTLDFLQIDAIKTTASYIENGYTAQGQIKEGRVVNTKGTIEVDGETKATGIDNLFIETNATGDGFGKVVIASKDGAELPTLDRGEVAIGSGVLVVEVQEMSGETKTNDEFIWLFGNGTVEAEKVVVTTSISKPAEETAELDTSKKSGKAGGEIANIAKKNADGTKYLKADGSETDNPAEAVTEKKASIEDVKKGTTLFAGGAGSENNPFLITNIEQWAKMSNDFELRSGGYSWKVINDLDFSSIKTSVQLDDFRVVQFNGTMDFNNHTIQWMTQYDSSLEYPMFCYTEYFDSYVNITIKNANFVMKDYGVIAQFEEFKHDITFENCDIYGAFIESPHNNCSVYTMYWNNGGITQFVNCDNYANITKTNTATAGIYAGYAYWSGKTIFDNCNNYGSLINTAGPAAMLFGNCVYVYPTDIPLYEIKNCKNSGTIIGTKDSHLIGGNLSEAALSAFNGAINDGIYTISNTAQGVCSNVAVQTLTVENDKFVLPSMAEADYYVLSFTSTWNGGKGTVTTISYYMTESERSTLDLNAYRFATGNGSSSTTGATPITIGDGTMYVKDGQYLFINAITTSTDWESDQSITRQPTVAFLAFDKNGELLAMYNYSYSN